VLYMSFTALIDSINHPLRTTPVLDGSEPTSQLQNIDLPEEVVRPIGYAAILERPIFSRTRRPYVPPTTLPPAEQAQPTPDVILSEPQFILQGIFIRGHLRLALIQTAENSLAVWIREGEEISGWVLAEIEPNELILQAGGQKRTVELYVEK
jgi:hypothetical protein